MSERFTPSRLDMFHTPIVLMKEKIVRVDLHLGDTLLLVLDIIRGTTREQYWCVELDLSIYWILIWIQSESMVIGLVWIENLIR